MLVAFIARTRLSLANKKNQKHQQEISESDDREKQKNLGAQNAEIWDNDPRYVFLT